MIPREEGDPAYTNQYAYASQISKHKHTAQRQPANTKITIPSTNDRKPHWSYNLIHILPAISRANVNARSVCRHFDSIQLVQVYRNATLDIRSTLERSMSATLDRKWTLCFTDLDYGTRDIEGVTWRESASRIGLGLLF